MRGGQWLRLSLLYWARLIAGRFFIESEGWEMNDLLGMGGGSAQDDWPELEPNRRNDRADDPDADPSVTDDEENRPGVPASDPESGA